MQIPVRPPTIKVMHNSIISRGFLWAPLFSGFKILKGLGSSFLDHFIVFIDFHFFQVQKAKSIYKSKNSCYCISQKE